MSSKSRFRRRHGDHVKRDERVQGAREEENRVGSQEAGTSAGQDEMGARLPLASPWQGTDGKRPEGEADDPALRALFAATPAAGSQRDVQAVEKIPGDPAAEALPRTKDLYPDNDPRPFIHEKKLPYIDPLERDITSTVHQRLEPELRARIDRDILDRRIGGLRMVFRYYALGGRGLSLASFCRYAKRLRQQAVRLDAGELAPGEGDRAPAYAALHLIQRLLEALVLENPSPEALEKLTRACFIAVRMEAFIREQGNRIYQSGPDPTIEAARQEALAAVQALRSQMAAGDALRQAVVRQVEEMRRREEGTE